MAHALSLPPAILVAPPTTTERKPMIGVSIPLDFLIVLSPWIVLALIWVVKE